MTKAISGNKNNLADKRERAQHFHQTICDIHAETQITYDIKDDEGVGQHLNFASTGLKQLANR